MAGRTVWLVGATGLVGRETLNALLESDHFTRVVAFTRRSLGLQHPKLEERLIDFEQLEAAYAGEAADAAVCCLGTTIKAAGSQAQFRRVDHDYPLAFARAAKQAGAAQLVVVTAMGANARASVFYNRVKGELEEALAALGFASLSLARPSLLLGERAEFRLGERLFAPLAKLLPARYKGIEARTVARAILALLRENTPGKRVALSDELQRLGA
jgi:uncharacterized protein YbjT (DUF2867 family)